jgi:peptide/nickel transport system substrate-binding protein
LLAAAAAGAAAATGTLPATAQAQARRGEKVRQIEILITTADYDPVRYEFGLMAAANWRKLGFDVKATPMEFTRLSATASRNHDFDIYTIRRAGRSDVIDPDRYCYSLLHSSQANKGQENSPGYANPEYDKWAELQRTALDPTKRREAVWKCQELLGRDQPFTPIVARNQITAFNARDFDNWSPMMGEAMNSLWNFASVTPKGSRKVLKWGYPSDVHTLNPLATSDTHDFWTLRLIYDRLVQIDPKGVPQPWVAQEIRPVDATTFQVRIRPGLKFHDGKPLTAQDVKFSFEYPLKVKAGYFMGPLSSLAGVDVVDDLTVRIRLKQPSAPFVANAMGQVFLLPRHIWQDVPEKVGVSKAQDFPNLKAVGSGMFKVEYWRRNEEMKLAANPDHFAKPKIEGILKIPYANVQGMVAGIETGECDMIGQTIEPLQARQLQRTGRLKIQEIRDHGFYVITYNMRRKPFSDLAVRKALAYGIPKSTVLKQLLEDHGELVHSMITPANEFWHNPKVEKYDLDMDKARKVLADAGYTWDEKGAIYYPAGKTN